MLSARHLFVLAIPLLALLPGCSDNAEPPAPVAVYPAKLHQISPVTHGQLRRFPAQVQAAERAPLAFRVNGELVSLPAQSGQVVKEGTLLARLDPADFQLRLDDRKARFELAQSQFRRIDDLFTQGQISRAQYDQAKAELDISKAAMATARTELSYTELRAPFAGVVAEVYADNHQPVTAGKTVVMLQAADQLEVRVQVPENLMAHLLSGTSNQYQPEVEFEALPGQRFHAAYKEHTAQADPQTGSFTVTLAMARPAGLNVLPGMSASVHVDLQQVLSQQTPPLLIPPQAVLQSGDQLSGSSTGMVWLVNADMTLSPREVTLGQLTSEGLEIRAGLQPGETILAAGVHQAWAGMKIRPWVKERGL